jgi:hypothetical protein
MELTFSPKAADAVAPYKISPAKVDVFRIFIFPQERFIQFTWGLAAEQICPLKDGPKMFQNETLVRGKIAQETKNPRPKVVGYIELENG